MSTNIYINSSSFNLIKVGLVTQNCSVCQGNEPKSKHTIPPTSGTSFRERCMSGNDAFDECSGDLMSKKGYFAGGKEFSNQKLHNVHQMEEDLSVPKKSFSFKVLEWNLDLRQRSKDVCIYCASTHLNISGDKIYCSNCSAVQMLPFSVFKPSVITSSGKVMILGDDGLYQVPTDTCKFCSTAALERVSNNLVCLACQQSQFQNPVSGDQVIIKLPSGDLLRLKGSDSNENSNKDTLIIEADVNDKKYLLCEDCWSLQENGTPLPTF